MILWIKQKRGLRVTHLTLTVFIYTETKHAMLTVAVLAVDFRFITKKHIYPSIVRSLKKIPKRNNAEKVKQWPVYV